MQYLGNVECAFARKGLEMNFGHLFWQIIIVIDDKDGFEDHVTESFQNNIS